MEVDKVAQPELAKHDSSILDLAFAMDCTGSMGSYIRTAQQSIRSIVEEIVSREKSDIHLALVEYRDHPPQDSTFVTRVHDFTQSVSTMKTWLDGASAQGGGDTPEAVADALHQVLKLSWRDEATKICVFIADAPPHGLRDQGDGFPNGCPDGIDPIQVGNQLAEKGVTMYMVGCEPSITPYRDFFMAIAHMTGGQYVPLRNAKLLSQVIIGGAQEEISLQRLMEEVNEEVLQEFQSAGDVDEEVMTSAVMSRLAKKGVKSKQLKMNKAELAVASDTAMRFSSHKTMAAVKMDYMSCEAPSAAVSDFALLSSSPRSCPPPRTLASAKKSKSRKSKKGGFLAMFSRSSEPEEEEEEEEEEEVYQARCGGLDAMGGAPGASLDEMASPVDDMYEVEEEQDVTYLQAQRMVKKSIATNKLSKK